MSTYSRTSLLSYALIGYEQRKTEIDEAIARIRAMLRGKAPTAAPTQPVRRKHGTMSPAARKRMALMMKLRWAKAKKAGKRRLG